MGKQFTGILVMLALLLAGPAGCSSMAGSVSSEQGTTTTVIMTRHAERTQVSKVLTAKGHQRARDLVTVLEGHDLAAIYSPDLERNLDTVKPLAEARGITITVKPAKSTPLVDDIVDEMLSTWPGGTVLWVGNVDNLQKMYWRLGGDGDGPIVYGDLFFMTVRDDGTTEIEKTRFGSD